MGPTDVSPIHVPYPDATDREIRIIADGCQARIRPGQEEEWVSGTYHDPSGQRSPKLTLDGGTLTIDHSRIAAHPPGEEAGEPVFDLTLGRAQPYALTIQAAAIVSDSELGGLPLTRLAISQRAGRGRLNFGEPNPQSAQSLQLSAEGAVIEARNLANANVSQISLTGEAAGYRLDFGGVFKCSSHVEISSRASSVAITVPPSTPARISLLSLLGDVHADDGFSRQESAFWTSAPVAGDGPLLTIEAAVETGQLKLRLREQTSDTETA